MNLREAVENNLTLFVCSFLLAGFLTGMGAYRALLEITRESRRETEYKEVSSEKQLDQLNEGEELLRKEIAKNRELTDTIIALRGKVSELEARLPGSAPGGQVHDVAESSEPSNAGMPSISGAANPEQKPAPVSKRYKIVEAEGFSFNLTRCYRAGGNVYCNFVITNQGSEQIFELTANRSSTNNSRAIDEGGYLREANYALLGGSNAPDIRVPTGVPISAVVVFKSIPESVREFSLLKINFRVYIENYEIEFRNISIE